jgi:hypothetical protein
MNTYSDDNGDTVMLNEHDMESFLLTEEAEADGDTSMLGMDVLDSSMSTSSVSAAEDDDSLMLLDVDEESTMSIDPLTTDDLVVPMKRLSICLPHPTPSDDMSITTSSVSGEGADALMLLDVDEVSTMSIDPLTTDDLVVPMRRLSICLPHPTPTDDMSITTSSVSGEGEDALMPDVDEVSTMSIDPLTTDDLVVPLVRLSICIPTDVLVTSTVVPLSPTREADAVMTDVIDNVTPGYQKATDDHVRSMASLSTMDERKDVDAAIDPTSETATAPMSPLSLINPFAANDGSDVDSVMSPISFHFTDMSSLVSGESLDYEEEFDYEDTSTPSLGSDDKVDDLQSSGSSTDPDEFNWDDISIGSIDEFQWANVDAIPSPGPSGDQDEFDSDSISPRLGSDNEFELEEVDATGTLDVVAFPVVFVVVTLSDPINVEEVSDAVQDQDENQGFEPSIVGDDLIEETTETPERTTPTVPPVELRRSARIAAKSRTTVILPVGTKGSVYVNGKRRSARLSLF